MPILSCVLAAAAWAAPEPESEPGFWEAPNQCAAWSVYHAWNWSGGPADAAAVTASLPMDGARKSLEDMRRALAERGIASTPRRIASKETRCERPMIALLRLPVAGKKRRHFVFVPGRDADGSFVILDGLAEPIRWTPTVFKHYWTGDCLELGEDTSWSPAWLALPLLTLALVPWRGWGRRGGVTAAAGAAALAAGCGRGMPESPIVVREGLHVTLSDTGGKPDGSSAAFDFTVENTGGRPVKLGEPMSTCGCLSATWDAEGDLPPRQSRVLHVKMSGTARSGAKSVIRIPLGVDTQPELALSVVLRPSASPPWLETPEWLRLGNVGVGEPLDVPLTAVEAAAEKPWIEAAELGGAAIAATLDKEEPIDDRLVRRRYRVRLPAIDDTGRAPLRLKTRGGRPATPVTVLCHALPTLVAEPASLRTGATTTVRFTDAQGGPCPARLRGEPPAGVTVRADGDALVVAVRPDVAAPTLEFEAVADRGRTARVALGR